MKQKSVYLKILAAFICFAMLLQSGFVVPASAEGNYSLYVHYMTGTYNIEGYQYAAIRGDEHPVIIPPDATPDDITAQLQNSTGLGNVASGSSPVIAEPYRVLGYTFDGWYYNLDFDARDPYASASKYDGTVTAAMADGFNTINLYAKWSLYNSPDITSDSVSFVLQNDAGEYINDPIMWTNSTGGDADSSINFDSSVTDYYGYVYGDASKIKMSFEQYDPGRVEIQSIDSEGNISYSYENQAYSTVKFNNKASNEAITSTDITLSDLETGEGKYRASYGYSGDDILYIDNDQALVSGVNITTDNYMELKHTQGYVIDSESPLPEENIISVTVYMPSYFDDRWGVTVQNTKTYNFHIKRLDMQLRPAYGNTPFGRIMSTYSGNESMQTTLKNQFIYNYTYSRFVYSPSAWNIYGDEGVQVVMGSTLGDKEYINYDEDETAIVVTEGEEFNDPGVTLYENGTAVDSADIKRKIHYTTINSLRYDKWHSDDNGEASYTETDTITSGEQAKVSILKEKQYVKPGLYTIDYEYTPAGMDSPVIAHRNMIVLPKQDSTRPFHFDINMDNFINALDALIYNIVPEKDKYIIDNVYLYRVLDNTGYGTVDENDRQRVIAGTSIVQNVYPSLAVTDETEAAVGEAYNITASEESGKAHLYMDYLGKDGSVIPNITAEQAAALSADNLDEGDVFYIGYRFTGVENLTEEEQNVLLRTITISTSYDKRYIAPNTSGLTNLKAFFKNNDKQLYDDDGNELFDIMLTTNPYSTDKSTAFEKWNNIGDGGASDATNIAGYDADSAGDTSAVSTMRLELYLKNDKTYELKNDEYILKLPMKVVNIPPSGEKYKTLSGTDITRKIISAKLGANSFNLAIGGSYGYMWDMSRTLNTTVTKNLIDKLQYMGSFVPAFAEEKDPVVIEATYKEALPDSITLNSTGIFEGDLPPGVTYETGRVMGTPAKSGDYEFYVGGVRYKMHVNKRTMTVKAIDREMTYGDDPITFNGGIDVDYEFETSGLADGDTLTSEDFTSGLESPVLTCDATNTSDVGAYDINITLADSANYTFTAKKGTLTVKKRPLTVTAITKAVPDYYAAPDATIDLNAITLSDSAKYSEGEFAADTNNIVNGDDLQITYDILFTSEQTSPVYNVTFKNIKLADYYGKGKNYQITEGTEIASTGRILQGQIVDFGYLSDPQLEYTYGDKINLNSGEIYITIQTGETTTLTQKYNYLNALNNGIKLELWRGNTKIQDITDETYMPSVALDNNAAYIKILCDSVPANQGERTNRMSVNPMPIKVRADDKERFYGDSNETQLNALDDPDGTRGGLTYSIITDGADDKYNRIVTEHPNGDTQQNVLTDYITITTSDSDTEIRAEDLNSSGLGSTLVPINLTYSGTNVNYDVTVLPPYNEDTQTDGSRMKIKQRPLTITKLTAPTLKATDYINSDGTKYSPSKVITAFAVAGEKDGEAVTDEAALPVTLASPGTSSGLYNNDAVKIDYSVRYVDDGEGHNYPAPYDKNNITVTKGMDTSFEKSRNYYLTGDIDTVEGSKEKRRISDIEVIRRPKTQYIFGEAFELTSGGEQDGIDESEYTRTDGAPEEDSWIRITYDTGEVSDITLASLCEDFASNDEYNDNLDFTITINGAEKTLNQAFMDAFNKNDESKHFNVKDTIKIALKAKNVIDGETRETKPNQENYAWEWTLTVVKQEVHVSVDDQSTLYDQSTFPTYTCHITAEDFRWGQSEALATGHSYSCLEDDNRTPASENTPAGIYTINLTIPDTDNYTFSCTSGTLTVRQRPLIITKIKIPDLSAEDAEDGKLEKTTSSTWTSENDGGITFADGYKPFDNETVTIKYTYTYQDNPRGGGTVDVVLSDISLDRLVGNARNYYLQSVETELEGDVTGAYITRIYTSHIQGRDSSCNIDQTKTQKYVYGDTLDLSGMQFTVYYNSGGSTTVYSIEELKDLGVKAEFYKKNTETDAEEIQSEPVTDGAFLTLDYSDMYIKLSLADDNANDGNPVTPVNTENTITVNKRPIHIRVNDSSYTYGDNPPSNTDVEYGTEDKDGVYTYYLYENDFPETAEKTKADFCKELVEHPETSGYVAPKIYAHTENGEGAEPDNTTDATDYTDASRKVIRITADASSASSNNYTFAVTGAHDGILVVKQRTIKATGIVNSIIPTLTADIAYQNGNQPPITISVPLPVEVICEADNTSSGDITVGNMVKGGANDKIAFTFDTIYDSVEDTGDGDTAVMISNFRMVTDYTKYPDAKNYILDKSVPDSARGKIITRRISSVAINSSRLPTLSYTYGQNLKIENGIVIISYTSGESDNVSMDKLYDYNIDLMFVTEDDAGTIEYLDNSGVSHMLKDLTETLGKPESNKLLTVKDYNGVRLCVKPNDAARVESEDQPEKYVKITSPITVKQKSIDLIADDLEMTYGENVPELKWHYNQNDLVNGDTLTSARFTVNNTELTAYDSEKHKDFMYLTESGRPAGNPVNPKTPVGSYKIKWLDPSQTDRTTNYSIHTVEGNLTINSKPVRISRILNVPDLTPAIIAENNTVAPVTIHTTAKYPDYDANGHDVVNFEFEEGYAPLDGDKIEVSYDAVYDTLTPGDTTVEIKNVTISTDYGENKNYNVESAVNSADGEVIKAAVSGIEITVDPVMRDDDASRHIEYTYADRLNLNRGAVKLTYNDGSVLENIKFNEIESVSEGLVKLVYADDNGYNYADFEAPEDGQVLYVNRHNGKHIKLNVPDNSDITLKYKGTQTDRLITQAVKVNKAPITSTVRADSYSRIYGEENPRFYCEYSGFLNGDTASSENFTSGLAEPVIKCDATIDSVVGDGYRIWAEGGQSDNYYFEDNYVDAELEITRRPLDVEDITGGIPALTSKIIREQPGFVHVLEGYALSTAGQLVLGNLYKNDVIRVSYDVTYTSVNPDERNVTVSVSNVTLLDDYGDGSNYYLRNVVTMTKGGNIYTRKIASVDITSQPKLEYTYGEYIDLAEPGVRITYDDDAVNTDVPYDQLDAYDIDLYITYKVDDGENGTREVKELASALTERQEKFKNGEVTEEQQKLTTDLFTGAYYTLVPRHDDTIYTPSLATANSIATGTITVNKKLVNVNIHPASSTYGDNPFDQFSFGYGDDYEYGETSEEVVTTAPEFVCTDESGRIVDNTTEIGTYTIKMTEAAARNYTFHNNNNELTIEQRRLTVSNITGGIPDLTAAIIKANMGETHYIPAFADSTQLVSDRVNNDDIRVSYDAVYYDEDKNDSYNVGIANMELVEGYGRNRNYFLNKDDSVKLVEGGGRIIDKEITEIEITEQPRLEYTYGELLDLSGGNVHITYDTGYDDNVKFDELTDYRITPMYYDTETAEDGGRARDEDRLYVPNHNGRVIRLTARSVHEVEPKYTEPLTVEKRVLTYGVCPVNSITYDGSTTETTGTVVFSNMQFEDQVTATAVFNFEDYDAGEGKTVYITDVKLDSEWTANYELSADHTTSTGTINKTKDVLTLTADSIFLSDTDNSITVTPPEMTEIQKAGGAKYEYSTDGGETWSEDNVFTGLELGTAYEVCIRLAETDNYAETDFTEPITITTYKVHLTLTSRDQPAKTEDGEEGEYRVLRSFYTNVEGAEKEDDFKALIGTLTEINEKGEEQEVTYYTLYDALENGKTIQFPLSFIPEGEATADITIYTTLTAPRRGGGSGGGGTGETAGVVISFTDENGEESKASKLTVELGADPITLKGDASSVARNAEVAWSSDNPEVASVNSAGVVKFNGVGTAVITASVKNNKNAATDSLTITVTGHQDSSPTPSPTASPDPDGKVRKNIPYLHGFEGMIKPDDYMTRAEAATILIQLMGDTGEEYENIFPDVREGTWYIDIIAQAAARGLISGFEDGTFRPEETVTREQFAAMVVRLAELEPIEGQSFTDVEATRWSAGRINAAVENGIITGYADGTFMPENPTRRSEAVRMINVATGRIPDKTLIDTVDCPYSDLPNDHWAYYEFMIAAAEFDIPE